MEPDPENFALLTKNIHNNKCQQILAVRAAAGTQAAEKLLYRYGKGNAGRHSLLPIHEGTPIAVQTLRLDELWRQHKFGNRILRLIKIDVEGYELQALTGVGDLLSRCEWVLAEFSPEFMRKGGTDPGDLVALLTGHGLIPYVVDTQGLRRLSVTELMTTEEQRNILWARRSLPASS